jgi:hypothetical protein
MHKTIEDFILKVNRDFDFILNTEPKIRGNIKIVGSVALILQAILVLKSEKLDKLKDYQKHKLESCVIQYIPNVLDYDIVISTHNEPDLMRYYRNLFDKGFRKLENPEYEPSFYDISKGIKMIYKNKESWKIKIDFIGINIAIKPDKPCTTDYNSPDKYHIGELYIFLEKVCKLTNYKKEDIQIDQLNGSKVNKSKLKLKLKAGIFNILENFYKYNTYSVPPLRIKTGISGTPASPTSPNLPTSPTSPTSPASYKIQQRRLSLRTPVSYKRRKNSLSPLLIRKKHRSLSLLKLPNPFKGGHYKRKSTKKKNKNKI